MIDWLIIFFFYIFQQILAPILTSNLIQINLKCKMFQIKSYQDLLESLCCWLFTWFSAKTTKNFPLKKSLPFDPEFALTNALEMGIFLFELCQYYLGYVKSCFLFFFFYFKQIAQISKESVIFRQLSTLFFDSKTTSVFFLIGIIIYCLKYSFYMKKVY